MTTEVRTDGHQSLLRSDLSRQERLLAGVAEATRQLLAIADFDTAVNGALEAIATAAEIDRIFVYQNHVEFVTQREFATCPYEWTTAGVVKASELPNQFPMFYDEIEGYREWLSDLKTGQPVQKLAREMSVLGQDKQVQEQALSVLTVPIFLEGYYWGNFGFDDCTTERVWSEAEIAVLETAAASFAGALERRDNLAELQRRDALLKSVNEAAQCLVAMIELEQAIPEALRILGEGAQQDRVYVFENVFPEGPDDVFWEMPFEWNAPGIPSSVEYGMNLPVPMSAFPPQITEPFSRGQAFRCPVSELHGIALDLNEDAQAQSLVGVPVYVDGRCWGVLGFDDCTTERVWSDAEVSVLETAAACIGSAIERDRTRKEREAAAQARAEELSQVNSILQTSLSNLASQTDLNAFLGHVTHLINQAAGAFSGYVFLHDTSTNTLELRLSVQKGQIRIGAIATDPELFQHPFPVDITPAYPDLCQTREIGLYGVYLDVDSDLMWPGTTEWHRRSGHKEAAAVALFAGDQPIGMLGLTFDQEVDLRDDERDLIRALADQAALAIQLANLAEESKQTALLQEREQAAQARGAELAKVNHVLKETIDTLVAEPELSRFLGLVLKAIAQQFNSPFLEFWSNWRTDEENITYLEQVVINGEVLTGEQLSGHHGINGLSVPPEVIKADDLSQRTQYIEIEISPNNPFIEPFYDNIYSWCRDRSVELTGHAINFPIILGQQSLGAIAIFLPKEQELSEETIKLGYALANQVALAMQLTQLAEDTKQTALLQEREAAAKARIAELAERDRILQATAVASKVLLNSEDFDASVSEALQVLGNSLGFDRIGVGQQFNDPAGKTSGFVRFLYEWHGPGIGSQLQDSEDMTDFPWEEMGLESWYEANLRDEAFGQFLEELPEPFRSLMELVNVKSTHNIPIFVEGQFWGVFGIDHCREQKLLTKVELVALKTAANCVGGAIARDRTRKEKEAAAEARVAELAERDRILEATAAAANVMLTEEDFDSAVNQALAIVGHGLEVDRILLGQHIDASSPDERIYIQFLHEWVSAGTTCQIEHPDLATISSEGIEYIYESLSQGQVFGGIIDELPEPFRSGQKELGVQSTYSVPIMVEGDYWGVIALDDCHQLTRRSEAELEALKTLANCIGNAVARDLARKEREVAAEARVAELAERDRILEASAAAANIMLTEEDFDSAVNSALQIVGVGLAVDRVGLMKHFGATVDTPGYHQQIFEYDSAGISEQINHPELVRVTDSGIEFAVEQLVSGEVFGGVVDELPEPFRSGQQELGAQSVYAIPIIVRDHYWGIVALDDCHNKTRRSEAELEALRTLANCIGNAIERNQARTEKEAAAKARVAELAERDRILEATAAAANIMLTEDDFDQAVMAALHIVGEGLDVDRINIGQYFEATSPQEVGYHDLSEYEWTSAQTILQAEHPEFSRISDTGMEFQVEALRRGEVFGGIVEELPEPFRSSQLELGVQSTYGVPIRVDGAYWGLLGFDDCHRLTRRSEAELEALITLANCIGNAIEREGERKEKEAAAQARVAELAERDRILEATAAAANVMLTEEDFDSAVNAALRIVGEGLTVDRIGLGQYTAASSSQEVGYHRMLFEWDSDDTPAQIEHSELATITDEGIEQLVAAMQRGEVSGGVVDEMEEPFRSKQKELRVQSTYAVPIRINSQYWGMIGFDDCHVPTRRSEAELEALMTLANCIGSAIERDRTRKEREATAQAYAAELETHNLELAERDRILEATAAAANVLLTDKDFEGEIKQALQLIGEAVGTDRVGIAQHLEDLTETSPGHWLVIHEWSVPEMTSVAELCSPDPMQGTYGGAEQLYAIHQRGKSFSMKTAQMIEPFRSSMAFMGIQALHAVPILLRKQYWGTVVFGDCRQQRQRSIAELTALQTVADCIGNAIDRDRIRKEREAATIARAVELKKNNEILSLRDRWLSATAATTEKLLSANDLKHEIDPALQEIGESLRVDRIGIMYAFERDAQQVLGFFAEWIHPSQPVQSEHEELSAIPCHLIGEQHFKALLDGQWYGGDIEEFSEPFCSSQKEIGVQSTYSVPIFIDSQFWGLIGIDHCREKKLLTTTEIAVFQTIASCFASAIQRDQIRKAREVAERTALIERERAARAAALEAANQVLTTRDRWLQTTATAANQLLFTANISNGVNTALQTLGTNLDSDRLGVMRHVLDDTELGHFQVLYEWDTARTISQIDHLELQQMPASDFADWTRQLMAGQSVGGLVEEQSDPFRTKMQSLGTLSTYAVPIVIEARFWGAMFMDYCRELRQLTPAELAVFETAATSIGSAIHREQMRCDREQAERDTLLQQEREQAAQKRATTLEIYNRQLQQRDSLLNSVNAAAQTLVANEELDTALPTMLKILGEGTEQCRAYILRNSLDEQTGELLFNLMLEWDAPQIPLKMEVGARFPVSVDRFPDHLTAPLKSGRATQFLSSELDGLSPAERQPGQALSLVGVPITVGGEWWGLLGLDDCVEERVWSDAEIAVLETAASAVGGAVERDRSRQARETAEKAVLAEREKAARERAAELAKTNEAISRTLSTLATNPELDNFLCLLIQELSETIGAFNTGLFLYNPKADTLYRHIAIQDGKAYKGEIPRDTEMLRHPFPSDITDVWQTILESDQPITFFEMGEPQSNASNLWWEDTISWHIKEGHQEIAMARMQVGDIPIGFIGFCFRSSITLSSDQLELIQALANQATLAIHLTQLADEARQTAVLQEQEKAARERAAELAKTNEAIARSLTSLVASPELDQFLGAIIAEMARQLNACKVHLFLYDKPTHTLNQRVAVQDGQIYLGAGPNDPKMFNYPIPADITPGWDAIINGERLITYDETQPYDEEVWWPETLTWHKAQGHKAVTAIPMKAGDVPIGYIGFCFYDRTVLSDEQLEFMQALANQAIVAIQLTRLADEAKQAAILQEQEKAARQRATELAKTNEAISQTLDALTTEPELDRFLGQILTQIIEQIGADDTHLFLYDAETHTLHSQLAVQNNTVYTGNAPGDPELFYTDIPADITAAWQILVSSSKPFTIDDNNPDAAEFFWPTTVEWHTSRGHQSATCACMKIGNQPIGFIGFAFCDQTVLSTEQLEFVQALTNQATLAIHLTRLAEQARTNALTDERNRLAREIHDTLAQAFTGISLQLEAAKNILVQQPETAKSYLDQARDLTRQGLSEARRSVHALRSQALESESLAKALQKNLTQMTLNTSLQTEFQIQGTPILLEEGLQLNLLRIGQEAITNALRHAQAKTLIVTLTFTDQEVNLCITDDGLGFKPQDLADITGFGLVGIRERTARYHGQVQIISHPGEGTTIEVTMPVQSKVSSPDGQEDGRNGR